jgi:hypothetical protein
MTTLMRNKSGEYTARKVIPKDVRQAYGAGWEARLTLPAHLNEAEAKARHGEWLADVETRIATLRAAANGEAHSLTRVGALALAGRWYSWFVEHHEKDLGLPSRWRELGDLFVYVIEMEAPVEFLADPKRDPDWEWAKAPEVREAVRPRIAETALVASFLAAEGLKLTPEAYALFVDAVSDNLLAALALLELWAKVGDGLRG